MKHRFHYAVVDENKCVYTTKKYEDAVATKFTCSIDMGVGSKGEVLKMADSNAEDTFIAWLDELDSSRDWEPFRLVRLDFPDAWPTMKTLLYKYKGVDWVAEEERARNVAVEESERRHPGLSLITAVQCGMSMLEFIEKNREHNRKRFELYEKIYEEEHGKAARKKQQDWAWNNRKPMKWITEDTPAWES